MGSSRVKCLEHIITAHAERHGRCIRFKHHYNKMHGHGGMCHKLINNIKMSLALLKMCDIK